jgi:hypothetical protein
VHLSLEQECRYLIPPWVYPWRPRHKYLFSLVSIRGLYLWILYCVGITLKLPRNIFESHCKSFRSFASSKGPWACHPLLVIVYFLIEISKRPMCIIRRNGWHITRGTQSERRVLHLKSYYYNKSYPDPMLSTSQRYDDRKAFLVVLDPCLTFLSSACISFTFNQVYSLIPVYHRTISLWFRKYFLVTIRL